MLQPASNLDTQTEERLIALFKAFFGEPVLRNDFVTTPVHTSMKLKGKIYVEQSELEEEIGRLCMGKSPWTVKDLQNVSDRRLRLMLVAPQVRRRRVMMPE